MRLFVGIRAKNNVPRTERGPFRDTVRAAQAALYTVKPWPKVAPQGEIIDIEVPS